MLLINSLDIATQTTSWNFKNNTHMFISMEVGYNKQYVLFGYAQQSG